MNDRDRHPAFAGTAQDLRGVSFFAFLALLESGGAAAVRADRVQMYRAWIDANQGDSQLFTAWFNLGVELAQRGDRAGAALAYRTALACNPGFANAAINLGLTLERDGRAGEALSVWADALQPADIRTALLNHRGRLMEQLGRLDEAETALRESLSTRSAQPDVIHHWVHLRQKMCRWPVLAAKEVCLSEADLLADCGPLAALALTDRPMAQTAITARWVARKTAPPPPRLSPEQGYRHDTIRLGYLSSDFGRHAMGYLISELLERHDRSRFTVYGYCIGREDGSDVRDRIVRACDHFVRLRAMSDEAAARIIAADEIDILIDLNGLTQGARPQILRARPAPIQATYLGFVGPVPVPELDYLLCDDYVIPPRTAGAYHPTPLSIGPVYQANDNSRIIGPPTSREENGLPAHGFVFCSFSNHYKITPEMFGAWMSILARVDGSILWLAADNAWSCQNLTAEARQRGIAPERLIFADRVDPARYISRLAVADLYLDTFPYNAGTIASDALRMGLPLLTLSGESFASRMAGCLLHALGATNGITESLAGYIETAVGFGTQPETYATYRALFAQAHWRETIGNTARFVRAFETVLVERHAAARDHKRSGGALDYLQADAPRAKLSESPGNMSASLPGTDTAQRTNLLIEGWRGISHSYGLINQFQILELLKIERLRLFHHDLPFFRKDWNRSDNDAGFPAAAQQRIDAIPPAADNKIDCVYRIASPIAAGAEDDRRKTLTFMITEMGMTPSSFAVEPSRLPFFTRDENAIITATRWSRDRIAEFGLPAEKIHILPLGADRAVFHPITQAERAAVRTGLGIRPDEILFVNVGGAFWTKGGDLLLRAFAHLRAQGRPVRMIVKDQRGLYGVPFETTLETVAKDCPELRHARMTDAISVIGGDLSRVQLRNLYAIADCYVSPYRAEGFNLPVLEAIACATPVIVTEGGATDDFCPDGVALKIPGRPGSLAHIAPGAVSRYIEPDLDALIAAMRTFAEGHRLDEGRFAEARAQVLEAFSWQRAAHRLAALASPGESGSKIVKPPLRRVPVIRQEDVMELMRMIRPHRMAGTSKVRIGNDFDGGYVLPETALDCDVVLSVGIGIDVSFDFHMAERGAVIFQFDHTVEQPPTPHPNFVFQKLGWGSCTEGEFLNFNDICARLTSFGARRLLKFDIEGAEYDVFDTVDPDDLATFEVITCEMHDLDQLANPEFFGKVKRFLGKLTLNHVPIHLHGNNYRRFAIVEGVPIPEVLEISLLRRDLDSFPELASDSIPGPLDRPNRPAAPDMCLTPFV